jgi:capsular polysaccharide transport system ATP-binding protein
MIILENVIKVIQTPIGPLKLFDGLSAKFRPMESVCILGAPGAGKTTLLNLISANDVATSGRIVRSMSTSWPITHQGFLNTLTVRDTIRFMCSLHNAPTVSTIRWIDDFVDLGSLMDSKMKRLPGKLKSKVVFAISIAMGFDCYLWDDNILVGDSSFREKSTRVLKSRQNYSSFIFATANPKAVALFCKLFRCDSIYLLVRGKLIRQGTLDEAVRTFR